MRSTALREPKAVRVGREAHVNVLLLANRNLEALDEICHGEGVTHQQYVALWTLCLTDDPDAGLPMRAVADGLLNRASDTTRLVDRLERAGLVERLANPADRRSVLVRATAEGRRVFRAVTPRLQDHHRHQWAHLSPAELDTLNALLSKALWGDATGDAPPPQGDPQTGDDQAGPADDAAFDRAPATDLGIPNGLGHQPLHRP
jgi:DNA-binding MarR family transcriptional regulator